MAPLILASTSPARRALLDGLQLPYSVESPGVEEDVPAGTSVEDAVRMLAARKAQAVFGRHREAFVLGADQLVSAKGRALGKPATRDQARAQLEELAAAPHELVTGVCLLGPHFEQTVVERSRLTLYPFRGDELERYLDTREWEGCAGGYRVEARGQWLMERIEGDRTNIQGLPMLSVVKLLRAAGFPGPGVH